MVITSEQIKKIEDAIARAEEKTSGEIVPMIVKSSSVKGHVLPMLVATLGLFVLALDWYFADFVNANWWVGPLEAIAVALISIPLSRTAWALRAMTVDSDLHFQVEQRAASEFRQAGLEKTDGSTGVLLFVSLAEHWAIVLGDKSIASKLDPATWNEVVGLMVGGIKSGDISKGFVDAIEKCGVLLSAHFPIRPQDKNELPNKLLIKD